MTNLFDRIYYEDQEEAAGYSILRKTAKEIVKYTYLRSTKMFGFGPDQFLYSVLKETDSGYLLIKTRKFTKGKIPPKHATEYANLIAAADAKRRLPKLPKVLASLLPPPKPKKPRKPQLQAGAALKNFEKQISTKFSDTLAKIEARALAKLTKEQEKTKAARAQVAQLKAELREARKRPAASSKEPEQQVRGRRKTAATSPVEQVTAKDKIKLKSTYRFDHTLMVENQWERAAVIGYVLVDEQTGIPWAVAMNEAVNLARKGMIRDCRVKSKKIGINRHIRFLAHATDGDVLHDNPYLKELFGVGLENYPNYTADFAQAVHDAYAEGLTKGAPKKPKFADRD